MAHTNLLDKILIRINRNIEDITGIYYGRLHCLGVSNSGEFIYPDEDPMKFRQALIDIQKAKVLEKDHLCWIPYDDYNYNINGVRSNGIEYLDYNNTVIIPLRDTVDLCYTISYK